MTTEGVKRDALLALEKRVAEAKEGSRELDKLIFGVTHDAEWRPYAKGARTLWAYERGTDKTLVYGEDKLPRYTASIDAALALVSRVLPGWTMACDASAPDAGIDWELFGPKGERVKGTSDPGENGYANIISGHALALILALLRSLTKGAGG